MSIQSRITALNWHQIAADLDARGYATTGPLLAPEECQTLIAGYTNSTQFRSHIIMSRHGYGQGEYKYYAYPHPNLIAALRPAIYENLAPTANRWATALNQDTTYPATHEAFLARCHQAGQTRPTPLLLQYKEGDYNCLHQDLYGDLSFPLQAAFLLSTPGKDFEGGEFVLTEQRPRMQSRAEVVTLQQGEAVIFATNHRPVRGTRGTYRTAMRHGVSRLRSGHRHTLGIILHDAR
eukprot:gene1397-1418_t